MQSGPPREKGVHGAEGEWPARHRGGRKNVTVVVSQLLSLARFLWKCSLPWMVMWADELGFLL